MSLVANVGCVCVAGRGIVIEGPPGSGKSSLALALIDRGATLVGDDGVEIDVREGRAIAAPPPHTAGLIEVRNVGLVSLQTARNAPIALVVRLDSEAPRFVDEPEVTTIAGLQLPLIRLWPDSPVLALRAEVALTRWGLP
ncbi:MAG: HPr kinase/phosphatase C-terminal domain-containing protein [Sphingomonadales bacterium]|nr:HPr kinase/phosphatase C-terminal domain-containing protein [Sphingomonadales bacterium]